MKSSEQIESLLKERIERLSSEITQQRKTALLVCSVAAVPLIALAVVALAFFNERAGAASTFLSAIAGIGLTIIIWNIGSSSRERANRSEGDRERMENLRLCLLAGPNEEIKATELMAMISRRESPFEAFASARSLRGSAADDEKQES